MNKNQFDVLIQKLSSEFDSLWSQTKHVFGWEETVCDQISPLIEQTLKKYCPEIETQIYYGRFKQAGHVFNIVVVDDQRVIVDGSFRQFDENSERLRIFWPTDEMYSRYKIIGIWR